MNSNLEAAVTFFMKINISIDDFLYQVQNADLVTNLID